MEFQVGLSDEGQRLDAWLATQFGPDASRTAVQRWIKTGDLQGPGGPLRNNRRVRSGERYRLQVPAPSVSILEPVDLTLDVIYEDADLAVVIKPAGIATHPGPGDPKTSLVNGLLHRWPVLQDGDDLRPGIVHRLDRDTEGLLLVALNERTRRDLSALFEKRQVHKQYLAWLLGAPPAEQGLVRASIGRHPIHRTRMVIDANGRAALTGFRVETTITSARGRKFARVRLDLHTGRTHQIRVHMNHLRAPVVGDVLYSRPGLELRGFGLLLFACRLAFEHPRTGKAMEFELPAPPRFQEFEEAAPGL